MTLLKTDAIITPGLYVIFTDPQRGVPAFYWFDVEDTDGLMGFVQTLKDQGITFSTKPARGK